MGVRADLEHGVHRGAFGDATRIAHDLFVLALRLLGRLFFCLGEGRWLAVSQYALGVRAPSGDGRLDARGLFGWGLGGCALRHGGWPVGAGCRLAAGLDGYLAIVCGRSRVWTAVAGFGTGVARAIDGGGEQTHARGGGQSTHVGAGYRGLAEYHRRDAVSEALREALRRAHGQYRAVDGGIPRDHSVCLAGRSPLVWVPDLVIAMTWSVLALTLGASSLLYLLIQRGAAAAVSSLMYLVPPCTALVAWFLFDEALTFMTVLGMAVTVTGVALVRPKAVKAT